MEPSIKDGSFHLVNGWAYIFRNPRVGDVVVLRDPQNLQKIFCKRVKSIDWIKKECYVLGDNIQDSLDSRTLGHIKLKQILGKVY